MPGSALAPSSRLGLCASLVLLIWPDSVFFHSSHLERCTRAFFESTMSSSAPSLTSSILIVGGGTWGCSTALHLARRGYKHVTVLDPYPIPSPIAAGNDINKIMEHHELKSESALCSMLFKPNTNTNQTPEQKMPEASCSPPALVQL